LLPTFALAHAFALDKASQLEPGTTTTHFLAIPRDSTPDLLPPRASVDKGSVATVTEKGTVREIKEWQAIMDYLRDLPRAKPRELPVIAVEGRAAETRSFKAKM
jgi:5'-nucleotidase/UDP-sugar diphosphatase